MSVARTEYGFFTAFPPFRNRSAKPCQTKCNYSTTLLPARATKQIISYHTVMSVYNLREFFPYQYDRQNNRRNADRRRFEEHSFLPLILDTLTLRVLIFAAPSLPAPTFMAFGLVLLSFRGPNLWPADRPTVARKMLIRELSGKMDRHCDSALRLPKNPLSGDRVSP